MTRIKRGYIARDVEQKFVYLHQAFEAHSRLTRTITQQKIRALTDIRRLWINRINAEFAKGVSYSYSRLIHDLYKRQLLFNRKILAQIAISNRNCLYMI
ncbi:hypothetical protein R3W88_030159 [Solanum pinnatisectum]|uniref:Large ribosomal subunit protein bL20c n=1 Tax=Solanum pinnatisectum TaxID=50273 RepID=A0AAV9K9F9_9SOLN|nr:hypothetical protein R3W88_030159 [Solanum pinnatisectum]